MIKAILWDVDGTLLDFDAAEREAIRSCFRLFSLGECTDEMLSRYTRINKKYWESLDRGELTKPEILIGRFMEFFRTEGIETDCAEAFNDRYQLELGETVCFCDNSLELVRSLKGKVKQYAVTNGTKVAQDKKLKNSGLGELFDGIFISEEMGFEKPRKEFFDLVFASTGRYVPDEMVIVGDSLTSDMRGGNNADILCCWYNPKGLSHNKGVHIDWEIKNLQELLPLLQL